MPRSLEPGRGRRPDRQSSPGAVRADAAEWGAGDPAADHARSLLRSLGLEMAAPARAEPVCPALDWALSGAMALSGEADGPPRFACGPLASVARGAGLALAALAPGRGFESLDAAALLGERAALFGFTRRGPVSCGGSAHLLRAGDAALALNLPRDDDWRLLEAWLEVELPGIERTRDWSAIARCLAAREADPLVLRGREIGLAVSRAIHRPDPPPAPFRLDLASHAPEADRPAGPRTTTALRSADSPRRPRRVLDLSALWAGPLAGALLAQAGFEVVKVESPHRPDGARRGASAFFDLLNADKRACALDLSAAADRAVFARLLDAADVVIESARPRALAQLGLDAGAWVGARPGRLWASITGHGREHEWIAFGDDAAVAAGLAFDPEPAGDERGDTVAMSTACEPRFCGDAIADPLTGLTAAVAIAALASRGRGGLLALSLVDVAAHAAHARPTDATAPTGDRRPRAANDSARLTLPLAWRSGAWSVHDGARWTAVAEPRARTPRGRSPDLRPPDAEFLARWSAEC